MYAQQINFLDVARQRREELMGAATRHRLVFGRRCRRGPATGSEAGVASYTEHTSPCDPCMA